MKKLSLHKNGDTFLWNFATEILKNMVIRIYIHLPRKQKLGSKKPPEALTLPEALLYI